MSDSKPIPSLFDSRNDYRDYLHSILVHRAAGSRGLKNKLANAIGCQPGFVSQVLGKHAHFNLEHGERINEFLGHTEEEGHYFLLFIQKTRAGTKSLREYFAKQMEDIHEKRLILKNRFRSTAVMNAVDQSRYYSAWYFGAIRVLLTIPEFRSKETISQRLSLPVSKVTEVLDFLISCGLALESQGTYLPAKAQIHLGNDSAMISRHHANWRARALVSLDNERLGDLHYSSVITVGKDDAPKLKEMTIDYLERAKALIRDAPAEEIFSLNLDFFLL